MTIHYTSGPVRLAYEVVGAGAPVLVVTPGWVSHLTLDWESRELLQGFAQTLMPIVARAGVLPVQPDVFPAHRIVDGRATTPA